MSPNGLTELEPDMADVTREEVDAKLGEHAAKIEVRLENLEAAIKTGFAELRSEMAKLGASMHQNTTDIIRWVVGTMFAFALVIVGLVTFVVNNAVSTLSGPAANKAIGQPGVIVLPQGTHIVVPSADPAASVPAEPKE
jgi:hypothetical protein